VAVAVGGVVASDVGENIQPGWRMRVPLRAPTACVGGSGGGEEGAVSEVDMFEQVP
jgi:hypothetical protein